MLRPSKPLETQPTLSGLDEASPSVPSLEQRLLRGSSTWKNSPSRHSPWRFYCPFCGVSRALRSAPRPGLRHFGQVLLTTIVFTAMAWPIFGVRGLFLLLPFWIAFEFLYRVRVRAELACADCGFDPALYVSDSGRARRDMQAFWEKKRSGGAAVVSAPATATSDGERLVRDDNPSLTAENAQG